MKLKNKTPYFGTIGKIFHFVLIKKDTKNKKTKFHNFEERFEKYSKNELEEIL